MRDESRVNQVLFDRARLFYGVMVQAGLFREPMPAPTFLELVSDTVHEQIKRVTERRSTLESIHMVGLPVALKAVLRDHLNLQEDELRTMFTDRAIAFHQALIEAKAYHTAIDEATFLEMIKDRIDGSVKSAMDEKSNILDMTVLYLPSAIVTRLRQYLHYYSWDYESGYDFFFQDLEQVLKPINIDLKWELTEEDNMKWVDFQIGDRQWVVDVTRTGFGHIMSEDFYTELLNVDAHLVSLGWRNIGLAAVDQVAQHILVPVESADVLEEWLLMNPKDELRLIFNGVRY